MRDAYGGIVNLSMLVFFLVLVCGYLAFNVNYTKAFRVKNYVITSLEQYEGNCGKDTACYNKINNYIRQIGYSVPIKPSDKLVIDGYTCFDGYCYKEFETKNESSGAVSENNDKVYYKVVTRIYIDIPIIRNIMPGLRLFDVSGNTKLITPFS